jgi:hypothetical protein
MTKIHRHILAGYILFVIMASARGQEVNVTASFDSTRIYIGDQIRFIVNIDKPAGLNLSHTVFKDTLIKNIEIISGPVIDSSSQNGRTRIIERYLVTSFDSGYYQIPPVYAEMKNENGLKRFYSEYSRLKVMRVNIAPADTVSKIFDIVKPYKAPVTAGEVLPWILIISVIGALVWLAYRYIVRHKKPGMETKIIINPDPAHIIALRQLEKLKDEKLWQRGEIKLYYSRLTEILRQYLEDRFRVYSLEMTTGETLNALVKTGFKKDGSYNQIKNVLTNADLVKFAKYTPEPSEHEALFQESWNFVLATREEPEIIENGGMLDKKGEGTL